MSTVIDTTPTILPANADASQLVVAGFNSAQEYASIAFNEATSFLTQIALAAAQLQTIPPVDGTLPAVGDAVRAFVSPVLPSVPDGLTMTLPPVPLEPALTAITLPDTGAAPVFTALAPVLVFPDAPAPLAASVPTSPSLNTVVVPAAPDLVLPDVPGLIGINVPVTPLLNLPVFTAITPTHPQAAANTFAFAEQQYQSSLLTDVRALLQSWIDGISTGLAPAVEQAIWDAARTRENVSLLRKMKESIRMYASRGFTKPPGALNVDIQQSMQDSQSTLSGLSRDIAIKQADLEQSNRRFAMDQAWKVEEGLINYQTQISQRAFDTAKYAQQVAVDIYHETVVAYTADIQAYAAQVEVYKAALTAELAKLDIYRAELDGQKLIGELNVQAVQVYTAEVDAARAVIDIFKAQVDAANAEAQINKTLIDAFASQVGAYGETVRAKAAEYDGYATLVKAQVSKADVFKTQADAYSSQVAGFKAGVDAAVEQTTLAVKVGQDVPLDLFKARTEVYRDVVQAETSRVDAVARVYTAETQAYSAAVGGEASRVSGDVAVLRADTDISVAQGNLRIEAAKANVQTLVQQTNLLIEAVKGGAQVAAQLAAASLASVNLSGQLGEHYNFSDSNSSSHSFAESNSSAFSTSQANNTTASTITSDSTANNTNQNFNN